MDIDIRSEGIGRLVFEVRYWQDIQNVFKIYIVPNSCEMGKSKILIVLIIN